MKLLFTFIVLTFVSCSQSKSELNEVESASEVHLRKFIVDGNFTMVREFSDVGIFDSKDLIQEDGQFKAVSNNKFSVSFTIIDKFEEKILAVSGGQGELTSVEAKVSLKETQDGAYNKMALDQTFSDVYFQNGLIAQVDVLNKQIAEGAVIYLLAKDAMQTAAQKFSDSAELGFRETIKFDTLEEANVFSGLLIQNPLRKLPPVAARITMEVSHTGDLQFTKPVK